MLNEDSMLNFVPYTQHIICLSFSTAGVAHHVTQKLLHPTVRYRIKNEYTAKMLTNNC